MTRVQIRFIASAAFMALLGLAVPAAGQAIGVGAGTGSGPMPRQEMDAQWTDAYRPGSGVLLPRPLREVKPRYTADAMRNKIQGAVLMECVVETDGTVRRLRVVRSLDKLFGLDEEAVKATRQWRFQPGTKDGRPVAVVVTIELTFMLGNRSSETAPLGLPIAFSTTAPGARPVEDVWELTPLTASPLTVAVGHPKGWVVQSVPDVVFVAMPPNGSFSVAMMTPTPVPKERLKPATNRELWDAALVVAKGYERQVVAMGQARAAGRLWFWFDLGVANAAAAAAASASPSESTAGTHQWIFSSTIEKHQVILAFTVRHARGTGPEEREAEAQRAGPVFAHMLERITFTRTP